MPEDVPGWQTSSQHACSLTTHLAAAVLVEQQLCIQVSLLLTEQILQVHIAPLERNVVHSNLQHSGRRGNNFFLLSSHSSPVRSLASLEIMCALRQLNQPSHKSPAAWCVDGRPVSYSNAGTSSDVRPAPTPSATHPTRTLPSDIKKAMCMLH